MSACQQHTMNTWLLTGATDTQHGYETYWWRWKYYLKTANLQSPGETIAPPICSAKKISSPAPCGNQFMQVPYHYNKEMVQRQQVTMQYIPTKYNLADLFTKSVSKQVLQELLPVLLGYRASPYPFTNATKESHLQQQ